MKTLLHIIMLLAICFVVTACASTDPLKVERHTDTVEQHESPPQIIVE